MASQPDPPKTKTKPKSSSTPEIPRSKFDDILDNTNPEDLDPLERNIFEAYKNARTLTHQSVKSHHGLKHSSTVNPAWTEHYGDWDAEQFSIDNQNKRDRGDEKRKRDKDNMPRWGSSAQSESSTDGTSMDTRSRGRSTTRPLESSIRSSSADSGIDMSYDRDDDTTDKSKYTNTSGINFNDSIQSLINDGRATLEERRRNRERKSSISSRSTSRSPTSSHQSDSRHRESDPTERSTGHESHTQVTSQAPRRRNPPDPPRRAALGYDTDTTDGYVPKYNGRNTKLRPIESRTPAHIRGRDSTVGWDDSNRTEKTFRESDPPTEVRSTRPSHTHDTARWTYPSSTNNSRQESFDATEYSEYDDTSHQSGWTLGTAAKLAATGAAAYGAYRLYQDPSLITDHVNADTLHNARDLASGVASNVYSGVTDMASGVASGLSSYAGSAWDTLGTLGGALGSTIGGVKDTIGSTVGETMTSLGPAKDIAYGYGRSAVGAMSEFGGSVAGTVDKHPWLASMAPGVAYNGAKLYMDYGRSRTGTAVNTTARSTGVKSARFID